MKHKKKSDGCTGVPDLCFRKCCTLHDKDYANKQGKIRSDWMFFRCMLGSTNNPVFKFIALTYYIGVSLFGWFWYYDINKKIRRRGNVN